MDIIESATLRQRDTSSFDLEDDIRERERELISLAILPSKNSWWFSSLALYRLLSLSLSLSFARSLARSFMGLGSARYQLIPTCMRESHPCSRPVRILFRHLRLARQAMNPVP